MFIDLAVFNLLRATGFAATSSSVAGAVAGLVWNFSVNAVVFSNKRTSLRKRLKQIVRFGLVSAASAAYLILLFELYLIMTSGGLGWWDSVCRVCIILSGTVVRFFVTRNWVFSGQEEQRDSVSG